MSELSLQPPIMLIGRLPQSPILRASILGRKEIISSPGGREALRLMVSRHPRLVIFDSSMPDMPAAEFCRIVRGGEATRHTSLLCIAERQGSSEVELCLAAGCNDWLEAPVRLADLNTKIERLISVPARRDIRTLVKLRLSLESGGRSYLGHTVNLSSSGMLLQTGQLFEAQGMLNLQFYLSSDPVPVQTDAKIVRAEFLGQVGRYGVEFAGLDPGERKRIGGFVDRLSARRHQ